MDSSKILATWWMGNCYHKEQLDGIISSTDIKGYAWILHDKDNDLKTKEPKKPHYHFLIQFMRNMRGSWFKRVWSDDMGRVFPEPVYAPEGAYNYLIHNTDIAKKDGKHLYDISELTSTFKDTDFITEKTEKDEKITTKDLRHLILVENKKPSELNLEFNLSSQQISIIDRLYYDYTKSITKKQRRIDIEVIYIFGATRTGKTRYVLDKHGDENVFIMTDYGENNIKERFDDYDGEDIILFDEFRSNIPLSRMLHYIDIYKCSLPSRYNNKVARYTKIYIVSNWQLNEQYPNVQKEKKSDWDAFLARIKTVYNFNISKDIPVSKKNELNIVSGEQAKLLGF